METEREKKATHAKLFLVKSGFDLDFPTPE